MAKTMKHRKSKRSQKKSQRRNRKMRGGVQLVSADTTLGGMQLPQGIQSLAMKSMLGSPLYAPGGMKGGSAPYPGSVGQPMLDGGMAQAAGTAVLDKAIAEALQAGGRKRRSKKSKKTRKVKKSKKSSRKVKKSKKSSRKSSKKSRKQRGGVMDVSDSTKMLLESSLMQKAGLNPEWRSIESGKVM